MTVGLLHAIVPFLDMTALAAVAGAALCLLWASAGISSAGTVFCARRCRRLLLLCSFALTVSSVGDLFQRTAEMSATTFIASLSYVSTVIGNTHYGVLWLVRIVAICFMWVVLALTSRRQEFRSLASAMLCVVAVVAFSRSSVSHASDFGDLSLPEISDWVHLLAAALWGGSLIALCFMTAERRGSEDQGSRAFLVAVSRKFYRLFGPVFATLVFTGLYNAWIEAGSFFSLYATGYGRLLLLKLGVFAVLTGRYVAPPAERSDAPEFPDIFLRKIRTDAALVVFILFTVALFTHEVPARHAPHRAPGVPQHQHSRHEASHSFLSHHKAQMHHREFTAKTIT